MHAMEQCYADLLYQQYKAHIHGRDLPLEDTEKIAELEKALGDEGLKRGSEEAMRRIKKGN